MKRIIIAACVLIALTSLNSCKDFLEIKSDKRLAVPATSEDLQAILDNIAYMNYDFIGVGEVATDDIFIPDENWNKIANVEHKMNYIWDKTPVASIYWSNSYRRILAANTVIEYLDKVSHQDHISRNALLGGALFFRGYTFFDLAQVFSKPYHEESAKDELGVALRLTADINTPSTRATSAETYNQIISDLKAATFLLPSNIQRYPTRPSKSVAYAALARVCLAMRDYGDALLYADSALQLYDRLLDYNEVEIESYPFDLFNNEVVFYSQLRGQSVLSETVVRVDTLLYSMYNDNDLRKQLYFTPSNGYQIFTGDYGKNSNILKFNGITTAEMLLIRAECGLRQNEFQSAIADLELFIRHRYKDHSPLSGLPIDKLMEMVLNERRKELIFRGVRWSDIRRLSFEPEYAISLTRKLNGGTYTLAPLAIQQFAFHLPQEIIDYSGMTQN